MRGGAVALAWLGAAVSRHNFERMSPGRHTNREAGPESGPQPGIGSSFVQGLGSFSPDSGSEVARLTDSVPDGDIRTNSGADAELALDLTET